MYIREKTENYYNEQAENYDEASYYSNKLGFYPANFYRLQLTKQIANDFLKPNSTLLDAGCGTGEIMQFLLDSKHIVKGCDISLGMIDIAKKKLRSKGYNPQIEQTSLENLSCYSNNEFDAIFCMGVFPYIPEELEDGCYAELYRVLRTGGLLITAHENELFDLFTFNKFTLRFFERNFMPLIKDISSNIKEEELVEKIASLITHPEEPKATNALKAPRDIIFTKPENPLTYKNKIEKYGFHMQDTLFYHFHCLPPLIRNSDEQYMNISKEMEFKLSREWQGLFLSSTFIAVAKKAL